MFPRLITMPIERSRRDITTPKKYIGFHMGKFRDLISPTARRTNSNHLDDDNQNLNINQGGSDGEKIKILEEQVSSRDEEISNLKKEIESLKKGCSKCIINAGAAAAVTAEEKEKEEEEEVVSVSEGGHGDANTEETNSDAKIKQLETKVSSLEGIMNEGFKNLSVMIGNIQGNTNNVNDIEQQQQQRQGEQQQQQQRQHQTVNRMQSEGRNQLQPQRNNNNSTYLNQLRQERKNNIILFKLPEMTGSTSEQWTADLYTTQCVMKEMELEYLENKIENVVRLGRDNSGNIMRPLKVSFKSNIDRETAVRNAYKLKNSEEFRNIGVSRDYIMQDRIEARENYLRNKQQNNGTSTNAGTSEPLEAAPISIGVNGSDQVHPQRSGEDEGS